MDVITSGISQPLQPYIYSATRGQADNIDFVNITSMRKSSSAILHHTKGKNVTEYGFVTGCL
jgi:hypothetical protein